MARMGPKLKLKFIPKLRQKITIGPTGRFVDTETVFQAGRRVNQTFELGKFGIWKNRPVRITGAANYSVLWVQLYDRPDRPEILVWGRDVDVMDPYKAQSTAYVPREKEAAESFNIAERVLDEYEEGWW